MPSMTITTDNGLAARLAAAVGRKLDLRDSNGPRDATAAEVKKFTIDMLRGVVHDVEREQAQLQISVSAWEPS